MKKFSIITVFLVLLAICVTGCGTKQAEVTLPTYEELVATNEEAEILKELAKASIVEKEVSIEFVKVNGEYKPQLTTEFLDAYYGGVYKLREEFLASQNKETK